MPGINIMRGPGDVTAYHFDGTYLNMILPVVVPEAQQATRRGQLIAYPNIRSFKEVVLGHKGRARRWRGSSRFAAYSGSAARSTTRSAAHTSSTATAHYHGVESPAEPGLRAVTNLTVGPNRF